MTLKKAFGGEGIKARDIKDVQKKTHNTVKALLKIQDNLIGKGPTDGLVPLAKIVRRDPRAAEFRQSLDKLVAKLFSVVDALQKDVAGILAELIELSKAGHDVLFIRDEDVLIENLRNGFGIIGSQLLEMRTLLNDLPSSADKEQLAMQVTSKYIAVVEELGQLAPVEERLEKLYKFVDDMV